MKTYQFKAKNPRSGASCTITVNEITDRLARKLAEQKAKHLSLILF